MEKPIDLRIVDAKNEIMKILGEANLTITICQMIINEIKGNIDLQAYQMIQKIENEYKESLKEEVENK
jgi:hypothetical protein